MAKPITELKWKNLTAVTRLLEGPNQFIKNTFFSNEEELSTEDIELSVIRDGARELAPFIEKNSEAALVAGTESEFHKVSGPNIRLKRPFTPSELLFGRTPGSVVFNPGSSTQISEVNKHIARDLKKLNDMIFNTEEYLCAMAIQGQIAYSTVNGQSYTITLPRDANHTVTLAGTRAWDGGTVEDVRVLEDVYTAKKLYSDSNNGTPQFAICGANAAAAFRELLAQPTTQSGLTAQLDMNNLRVGNATLVEQFEASGALYMGNIGTVSFWEYSRTANDTDGNPVSMIRPDYVEFLTSNNQIAERVMYYAAITDVQNLNGKALQSKRFSKSWEVQDPSSLMALVASRPLPWIKNPDASVSMKVTNV